MKLRGALHSRIVEKRKHDKMRDLDGDSLKKSFEFIGKTVKENWFSEMSERNIFLKDEKIRAAIRGNIESPTIPFGGDRSTYGDMKLSHIRDGLIGLTNKRVIFYMPKILNRYEFESYILDQISSVQFTKGLIQGRMQITAFNDYKIIKHIDNEEGKKMTEMLQNTIHDLKFKKTDAKNDSSDDDILKTLKLRYARGEINRSQFEKLKKDLV